ncbi:hypothetical protein C3941_29260 [Kaistia algarum]|nr:hypothetical protein C3941_29260 [Kaistia algarum]
MVLTFYYLKIKKVEMLILLIMSDKAYGQQKQKRKSMRIVKNMIPLLIINIIIIFKKGGMINKHKKMEL